mmetsp:Transcript_13713/g.26557  ORF Transcript_13713/g.26557 Transcript_13713/m.26557 type:complete len:495 (-) Transcript_13713:253-1737(-)|eukprot:CAMPEP_0171584940 /NCGR_PEP_ID=MMETSP0961-20121227/11694_1 /TAXON_ID=87120 /ORGANISM="Aurantiochytrium limacinum, Strain ATCCMYA-1381" /LENGTH=494 /DNA_ID=CAMNT_0012142427 /DNA_START=121 /DNA_END=1605 /DNA_ORIENTATION=-
MASDSDKILTSAAGAPLPSDQFTKSAGRYGPLCMDDFVFLEKSAHFNRERIPERVVHAVGAGAHGKFTVTDDISHLTCAKLFSEVGKETPLFIRFSTVARSKGGGDINRDVRGFAINFDTEEGIWSLVGNMTPVFFIRDPIRFMDFIHSQKEHPGPGWRQDEMFWDFWSHTPESLHQVMLLMSDMGIPMGYRHHNGYGSHTYSMINDQGERVWVKFHFKTQQGRKFLTNEQSARLEGVEPRWATKDLYMAIEEGKFPKWTMYVQTMTDEQAREFKWNPFDLTKVWPHKDFPLHKVGVMELNRNPDNYFAEVEQSAFGPHQVVPGIGHSPDPMLQARVLAYADAHRYRLGVNYNQIPINRPKNSEVNCPYRDGAMRVDGNYGGRINYGRTSCPYPKVQKGRHPETTYQVEGAVERSDWGEDDHYEQPKMFLDTQDEDAYERLINNIAGTLGVCKEETRERQLGLFKKVDEEFAARVAKAMEGVEPPKLEFIPGEV